MAKKLAPVHGGHSRPYGCGKIRSHNLLQVELDHHVLGDLPAFGGPVLQPVQAPLHLLDAALEAGGQGLIGKGGTDIVSSSAGRPSATH